MSISSYSLATLIALTPAAIDAYFQLTGGTKTEFQTRKSHYLPMLIPLAGPVWSLGYKDIRNDWGNLFWVSVAGGGEIVGAALFLGQALPPAGKRADPPSPSNAHVGRWSVAPVFGPDFAGLGASTTF